jgi:hypothetical protein
MELVKSIFEILNSNLGGLFVFALVGYGLFKAGEMRPVFKQMPELVSDMHQVKNRLALLESKVDHISATVDKLLNK